MALNMESITAVVAMQSGRVHHGAWSLSEDFTFMTATFRTLLDHLGYTSMSTYQGDSIQTNVRLTVWRRCSGRETEVGAVRFVMLKATSALKRHKCRCILTWRKGMSPASKECQQYISNR